MAPGNRHLCTMRATTNCTVYEQWCWHCDAVHWAPSVRHVWCTLNTVYGSTGQTGGVVNDLPKNITHSLSFMGIDPDVI